MEHTIVYRNKGLLTDRAIDLIVQIRERLNLNTSASIDREIVEMALEALAEKITKETPSVYPVRGE
jgi:hypothetical protein